MVVAQPPAEADADAVAGADLAEAGVHRADELLGLVDPAPELLGHAAEDEAGEDGAFTLAQRRPPGFDAGGQDTGRAGQGTLVARPGDLDEEHGVVEGVPDVELAGDLAVELAERVGDRGQRRGLTRGRDRGQYRLRDGPDVGYLLRVDDPGQRPAGRGGGQAGEKQAAVEPLRGGDHLSGLPADVLVGSVAVRLGLAEAWTQRGGGVLGRAEVAVG